MNRRVAMQDERPLPKVTRLNAPFFEAAAKGELRLQRCLQCQKWVYYPRYICPFCFSSELEWVQTSGLGRIISYSAVYRPQHAYFDNMIPIILIAVVLEEGPIIISSLVGQTNSNVSIGAQVQAVFETVTVDLGLLKFRIIDQGEKDGFSEV